MRSRYPPTILIEGDRERALDALPFAMAKLKWMRGWLKDRWGHSDFYKDVLPDVDVRVEISGPVQKIQITAGEDFRFLCYDTVDRAPGSRDQRQWWYYPNDHTFVETWRIQEVNHPWMTNPVKYNDDGEIDLHWINNSVIGGLLQPFGSSYDERHLSHWKNEEDFALDEPWSVVSHNTHENLAFPHALDADDDAIYVIRLDGKDLQHPAPEFEGKHILWGYTEADYDGEPDPRISLSYMEVPTRPPYESGQLVWNQAFELDDGNKPDNEFWPGVITGPYPSVTEKYIYNRSSRFGHFENELSDLESWRRIWEYDIEKGTNTLVVSWTFPGTDAGLIAQGQQELFAEFLIDYESEWCGYAVKVFGSTAPNITNDVRFYVAPMEDIYDDDGNLLVKGGMENVVHKFTYNMTDDIPGLPATTNGAMLVNKFWHIGDGVFGFTVHNEIDNTIVPQHPIVWGKYTWMDPEEFGQANHPDDPGAERVLSGATGFFPLNNALCMHNGPWLCGQYRLRSDIGLALQVSINMEDATADNWVTAKMRDRANSDPPLDFVDVGMAGVERVP